MDRSMTCWQCKHLADTKGIDSLHEGSPAKGLCELTHGWGSLKRGRDCPR